MNNSKVYIVGAGPGDPELITVKGLKAIEQADVILYDALSSDELLAYADTNCELIYVGKRCGKHSLKQGDINALIVQKSLTHQNIVRLKGGDPFVFGRGHEELTTLKKKDINVEVIPGITSVTSLPLLQEVPLTRRNVSESFWVLTGTTKDHRLSSDIYNAAKSEATVVVLMGMRKLKEICSIFSNQGKGELPAMVISNGSTPQEKIALGTVTDISDKVDQAGIGAPGIIILGEVVALHPSFVKQHAIATWS